MFDRGAAVSGRQHRTTDRRASASSLPRGPASCGPGRFRRPWTRSSPKAWPKTRRSATAAAGDMANAAHDALTAPEQHQEATILRQGDNATLMANAVSPGSGPPWTNYAGGHRPTMAQARVPLGRRARCTIGRTSRRSAPRRRSRNASGGSSPGRRRCCSSRLSVSLGTWVRAPRRHRSKQASRTNRAAVQRSRLPPFARRGGGGQIRRCVRHQ